MGYRVEELARACGVTVDTIRFYQTRGLLRPPARDGRRAIYDDHHVERLDRIRALKEQGFSLALIQRTLDGELDVAEQALAGALAAGEAGPEAGEPLSRDELADRAGVPPSLLEALEREGLLVPRADQDTGYPYDTGDLAAVQAGSALLEAGLPLSELLALAREHDQAMRQTADRAVDLFARFVRDPALGRAEPAGDADTEPAAGADAVADHVVGALQAALPAATAIVAHHFRRRLLAAARARLEGT